MGPPRLERGTNGLKGHCSTELSYGPVAYYLIIFRDKINLFLKYHQYYDKILIMFNLPSLIAFFIILAIYIWYTFAIVYHLIRFGVGTEPKKVALIFLLGSFIFFSLTIIAYLQINWGAIL